MSVGKKIKENFPLNKSKTRGVKNKQKGTLNNEPSARTS